MKLGNLSGNNFVAALDIGTASVKVAVAELRNGKPALLLVEKIPCSGIRKGAIVEMSEASQAVTRALAQVKRVNKAAAKNIYVSIGTPQAKMQAGHGIVAVSRADAEIFQDDIERVKRASEAVNLPQNRMIIHTLVREYVVDGVGDIPDPLGLSGSRLEVKSLIIDAFSPHVKSLIKIVELAGGEVSGLVFGPLVAARGALSKRQRDLGTALVDLGFGTTGITVYEENKLITVAKFPVGAANITNDLAIGLKIPVDAAEEIKLHYGYAVSREVGAKDQIELKKFVPDARGPVSRRFAAEIIESRLEEIFDWVNSELKAIQKFGELPGGVVFVGGGAKLPGLTDLAKQEMKLASQIGFTISEDWEAEGGAYREFLEDPEFVSAFGLLEWGMDGAGWEGRTKLSDGWNLKRLMKYFTP